MPDAEPHPHAFVYPESGSGLPLIGVCKVCGETRQGSDTLKLRAKGTMPHNVVSRVVHLNPFDVEGQIHGQIALQPRKWHVI